MKPSLSLPPSTGLSRTAWGSWAGSYSLVWYARSTYYTCSIYVCSICCTYKFNTHTAVHTYATHAIHCVVSLLDLCLHQFNACQFDTHPLLRVSQPAMIYISLLRFYTKPYTDCPYEHNYSRYRTHTHTLSHTLSHTHTCIYTHTHTHTHTHTQHNINLSRTHTQVSNRFDADPKRWRMLASLSMDVASFIELLTPFFPGYFLPLASIANVGMYV